MSGRQYASQTVCREGRTKTPGETCEILMSRETFKIQKQRQTDLSWRGEWERQGRTGRRRGCWRAFLKNPFIIQAACFSSVNRKASVLAWGRMCIMSLHACACECVWHGEWWMGWFAWKCFAADPSSVCSRCCSLLTCCFSCDWPVPSD